MVNKEKINQLIQDYDKLFLDCKKQKPCEHCGVRSERSFGMNNRGWLEIINYCGDKAREWGVNYFDMFKLLVMTASGKILCNKCNLLALQEFEKSIQ